MLKKKILIADDDDDIRELLRYHLEKQGYIVQLANNGREAVEKTLSFMPNIVLMDIIMPILDGIEACRQIRENSECNGVIISFITGRGEEYSEVAAFEAGGNDYLLKPIKPRALAYRLESYFNRTSIPREEKQNININNISIDKNTHTVCIDSKKIQLSKKEFDLLFLLCQYPNKVFKRDELHKKIWGVKGELISRTVDVHIQKIRKKIGHNYINTVKGIGYKLEIS